MNKILEEAKKKKLELEVLQLLMEEEDLEKIKLGKELLKEDRNAKKNIKNIKDCEKVKSQLKKIYQRKSKEFCDHDLLFKIELESQYKNIDGTLYGCLKCGAQFLENQNLKTISQGNIDEFDELHCLYEKYGKDDNIFKKYVKEK